MDYGRTRTCNFTGCDAFYSGAVLFSAYPITHLPVRLPFHHIVHSKNKNTACPFPSGILLLNFTVLTLWLEKWCSTLFVASYHKQHPLGGIVTMGAILTPSFDHSTGLTKSVIVTACLSAGNILKEQSCVDRI